MTLLTVIMAALLALFFVAPPLILPCLEPPVHTATPPVPAEGVTE